MYSVMGPLVWDRLYSGTWMFQAMNACVLYGGVLGGTLAVQSARRARVHERRQHELALAAREAELRALNAQLEPHFLLNTRNAVLALVDDSPRDARLMIERLADLLKAAFDGMEEPEVPLGRELDLLGAYLGIGQVRFADRLRVTTDVPEDLRTTPAPPVLMQPLGGRSPFKSDRISGTKLGQPGFRLGPPYERFERQVSNRAQQRNIDRTERRVIWAQHVAQTAHEAH